MIRVLVVSGAFPSSIDPSRGIFVKERIRALARVPGIEVRVIAPTPWAPPIRSLPALFQTSQIPRQEEIDGLHIYRPRYLLPPKIGGYWHPQLMYPTLLRAARRIHQQFPFDLVDGHFVYASGVAATQVARHFKVPVCVTGRGEDMLRFPSLPGKGRMIRWALKNGNGFVALSNEIAQAMIDNGALAKNVEVIPNGIDGGKFCTSDQLRCRKELGLPTDRFIILGVGDLVERKGFHIIVEAIPKILKVKQNLLFVCVGGPGRHGLDYTHQIQSRIDRLGLQAQVMLGGERTHGELYKWHNASDLFVLASSREGSPNALLEALACGSPVVSTRVGGAPDEIEKTGFGVMMHERSAAGAAQAIVAAMNRRWDRQTIGQAMQHRSWDATAGQIARYFSRLLPATKAAQLRELSNLW